MAVKIRPRLIPRLPVTRSAFQRTCATRQDSCGKKIVHHLSPLRTALCLQPWGSKMAPQRLDSLRLITPLLPGCAWRLLIDYLQRDHSFCHYISPVFLSSPPGFVAIYVTSKPSKSKPACERDVGGRGDDIQPDAVESSELVAFPGKPKPAKCYAGKLHIRVQ